MSKYDKYWNHINRLANHAYYDFEYEVWVWVDECGMGYTADVDFADVQVYGYIDLMQAQYISSKYRRAILKTTVQYPVVPTWALA